MTLPQHDAVIAVRKNGHAISWRGQPEFFRGHQVPSRGRGGQDGIYAEWRWDDCELVVRNDRYGASPLFFVEQPGSVAVSPSIPSLLDAGAPTELDEGALAVFLRLGFFVGDDTPFRHIRAVPPGAAFSWRDGSLSVSGGYTLPQRIETTRPRAIDAFVSLFRDAMRRRLPHDDRAVVPLSGGRDSRHILFELCAARRPPRCAVTIPRYPPRPHEDERIAPLVAAVAGVPHVLLDQDEGRFHAEVAKNWATSLCADEHAWYVRMVGALAGATTVYDGLGGALSVPSRFSSRAVLDLFERGNTTEIARRLVDSFSLFDERFLRAALARKYRAGMSREQAIVRLARELGRHAGTPDPVKSFNFWNRIRRELALVPYGLMRDVPVVYSPYLDRDVYDYMMALDPAVLSPALASADKSFHTDAIHRAFPQFAHIPFEDRAAPRSNAQRHNARFARDVARYIAAHPPIRRGLLNRHFLLPRLGYGALCRSYSEARPWLPSVALYLFQLDAAASSASATAMRPLDARKTA